MKRTSTAIIALFMIGCGGTGAPALRLEVGADATTAPFRHPGILVNQAQLDLVKAQVAAGVEPRKSAFANLLADAHASLSYMPKPWATVECGPSSNPNLGCSDERNDAIAAYTQALAWYITGNAAHAQKAIQIMNAWSRTLTGGHTNSNARLQSGWTGSMWPEAAEIIANTYNGWRAADLAAFKTMLKTQYLPFVVNGAPCENGNWELVTIEAVLHIGLFLDDHSTFDKAVAMWRARVPAYMYLSSDGNLPDPPPGCNKSGSALISYWHGQSTFVDGLAQETCRDFGHTQWGIAAAVDIAETALQQGLDLYSEDAQRIQEALEFHANYLLGAAPPSWLCGGQLNLGVIPAWEIAYNHFHNRLGLSLPLTKQWIESRIRPSGVNYFIAWETLTHALVGWTGIQH
jgi:hypothetical protein